jgi:hypothetical protein
VSRRISVVLAIALVLLSVLGLAGNYAGGNYDDGLRDRLADWKILAYRAIGQRRAALRGWIACESRAGDVARAVASRGRKESP